MVCSVWCKGNAVLYRTGHDCANIEVLILVHAFGMEQTLGNILFASTFLVTDILSELAGKKEADKAVNIGILTSVSFMILAQLWLLYQPVKMILCSAV